MKILVTGSSGFIGSAITHGLLKSNHVVFCFLRDTTVKASFAENQFFVNENDLLNMEFEQIDCIIHTAWGSVRGEDRNDDSLQELNLNFSIKIADLAVKLKVKKFIAFGSQAEYGIIKNPIDENTTFNPNTAYGKFKLITKNYLSEFLEKNEISFFWLRLFSVYGLNDYKYSLIMSTIYSLLKDENVSLTQCNQYWDFLNIKDVVNLVLIIIEKSSISGEFNIAFGKSKILKEFVLEIGDLIKSKGKLDFGTIPYNDFNNISLVVNNNKVISTFGWKPKIDFNTGISEIIQNILIH